MIEDMIEIVITVTPAQPLVDDAPEQLRRLVEAKTWGLMPGDTCYEARVLGPAPRQLDVTDPFDRVIGWACEAERKEAAQVWLDRFAKGLLTVQELAAELSGVVEAHPEMA